MNRAFLLLFLLCFGCYSPRDHSAKETAGAPRAGTVVVDQTLLDELALQCRKSVEVFYQSREMKIYWTRTEQDSLVRVIATTGNLGLNPDEYHYRQIEELLADTAAVARVLRDVLLTDAFLAIRHHVQHGRLDPITLQQIDLSRQPDEEALASLRMAKEVGVRRQLETAAPAAPQYHALKAALANTIEAGDSVQAQKIALNMERWRWEPAWPDRYVVVNIPAFEMQVVENDSVWLTSRVIVGKRETPTPVMESTIRSFIIYPYWHVPNSISTKEILPHLQADRTYLERHNFEVLNKRGALINADTIQWDVYSDQYFPFILRQREGSENTMGIIKFNFANPYGVYLHDTNSKRLFGRSRRDLSHGCVRVREAVPFAHYLVHDDDIYVSPEDLDQYLSLQQRHEIRLRSPIPIKMRYFTCEVRSGRPLFFEDIYRKDSVMLRVLDSRVMGTGEERFFQDVWQEHKGPHAASSRHVSS